MKQVMSNTNSNHGGVRNSSQIQTNNPLSTRRAGNQPYSPHAPEKAASLSGFVTSENIAQSMLGGGPLVNTPVQVRRYVHPSQRKSQSSPQDTIGVVAAPANTINFDKYAMKKSEHSANNAELALTEANADGKSL